jgi:hypothetical protein
LKVGLLAIFVNYGLLRGEYNLIVSRATSLRRGLTTSFFYIDFLALMKFDWLLAKIMLCLYFFIVVGDYLRFVNTVCFSFSGDFIFYVFTIFKLSTGI